MVAGNMGCGQLAGKFRSSTVLMDSGFVTPGYLRPVARMPSGTADTNRYVSGPPLLNARRAPLASRARRSPRWRPCYPRQSHGP